MPPTASRRILLVDDDPEIRRSLKDVLTTAGYEVAEAADSAEAIRRWREGHGGDLVILDLFMPEKAAIAVITQLRDYSPAVPIIAMAGGWKERRVDLLEAAKLLGINETLEKPFGPKALLALVARMLANAGE